MTLERKSLQGTFAIGEVSNFWIVGQGGMTTSEQRPIIRCILMTIIQNISLERNRCIFNNIKINVLSLYYKIEDDISLWTGLIDEEANSTSRSRTTRSVLQN